MKIDKSGKNLSVANRLHTSIGYFSIEADGTLSHKDDVWTRGDYTRTLTLSPVDKTLYAINQRSENLMRFQIDAASGALTFSNDYTAVGAQQSVLMP